jgi:Transposase domain (DUF772)
MRAPEREFTDSIFLSRISGGEDAGRICGLRAAVFIHIAGGTGIGEPSTEGDPRALRDVLRELNRSLSKLYASEGRPSIPPEQLLSALLLQVFYGIRSERQLMEQLGYNLLYPGSWDFRPTTRCGTRPCSRRIATGYRTARYSTSS